MAAPRRTSRWEDELHPPDGETLNRTDEQLRREIDNLIREERQTSTGEESEMRRLAEDYERNRHLIEEMIQDHIIRTDRPIDDQALDSLNMIRAAQRRNEQIMKSGETVQNKFVNLREIHKMIQAICEFLNIQLIEVPLDSSKTKYQAVKKGTSLQDVKRFDRSQDLIFDEEEDNDGTKG